MLFINIDGCNGVGKTSTIIPLKNKLESKGLKVKVIHFHRRGTLIGNTIQKILNGEAKLDMESLQMLYAVDQLDFSNNEYYQLEKENYDILISDRYCTSLLAIGTAMGLDLEHLKSFTLHLKKPNVNFILTAEPKEILKRVSTQEYVEGQTGDIFEEEAKLNKIMNSYKNLHNIMKNVMEIDTTVSTEKAANEIFNYLEKLM